MPPRGEAESLHPRARPCAGQVRRSKRRRRFCPQVGDNLGRGAALVRGVSRRKAPRVRRSARSFREDARDAALPVPSSASPAVGAIQMDSSIRSAGPLLERLTATPAVGRRGWATGGVRAESGWGQAPRREPSRRGGARGGLERTDAIRAPDPTKPRLRTAEQRPFTRASLRKPRAHSQRASRRAARRDDWSLREVVEVRSRACGSC